MTTPVIANVYRVAFDWQTDGTTATNVIHVYCEDATEELVNTQVQTSVNAGMWKTVADRFLIRSLSITKLDGSPDAAIFPTDLSAVWQGGTGGQYLPPCCGLVKFGTGGGGRRGRGRAFLPFLGEGAVTDGVINGSQQTDVTAGWTNFRPALALGAKPAAHVVASYTGGTIRAVTTSACEALMATQRRRLHR